MRPLPSRPVRAYNISRLVCCLLCGLLLLTVAAARSVAQTGISYRSSATASNGSAASSITVNKPAGTVTDDVMVATIFVRGLGTTPSVTAPAGWTLIRQDNIDGGVTAIMPSYYRVAGASEPANYAWTFDSSRLAVAVISSYSGVSTSAPIDAHNGQWIPTSSPITAPSVTTTVANTMLVGWFALMEGGQNISPPTGMTERAETSPVNTNLTLQMSDELRAAAGPTGQRDATVSFEDNSIGQLIALKPPGGGGNNPPTVSITSPANNATFTAPANITINASAEDSDGTISQVEFLQGTTSLFVDTSAPYSYAWNNVGAGSYTLTAKATDNVGATTTSTVVNVTVNESTGGSPTGPAGGVLSGTYPNPDLAVDRVRKVGDAMTGALDISLANAGSLVFPFSLSTSGNVGPDRGLAIRFNLPASPNSALGAQIAAARESWGLPSYVSFSTHNGTDLMEALRIRGNGNVGVGATNPVYKLDVAGQVRSSSGGFVFPDGTIQTTAAAGGGGSITAVNAGSGLTGGGTSGSLTLNVGAGTGITVAADTVAVNYGSTAGTAVQGNTSITVSAGAGMSEGGSLTLGAGGSVTLTNADRGSSQSIFKNVANSAGTTQFSAGSNTDSIRFQGNGGTTVSFDAVTKKVIIDGSTSTVSAANISAGQFGAGNYTFPSNVTVVGTLEGGNIKAKYQDVAEWVDSSQELSAGTVVILDSTRSNQVIASTRSYDTRVAGVISLQPGIVLGEQGEGRVLVATTGRVKVRVDASNGPIQIGDLLVTSDREGFAKKSVPLEIGSVHIHRPGTLIGKALEPLAAGTGEILVLLSLQ